MAHVGKVLSFTLNILRKIYLTFITNIVWNDFLFHKHLPFNKKSKTTLFLEKILKNSNPNFVFNVLLFFIPHLNAFKKVYISIHKEYLGGVNLNLGKILIR